MEGTAAPPLPPSITYPQKVKSAKDKKTYKHQLLKKHPETLMADYFQKGDTSTITNLLLYTENCNAWHTVICKYYRNIKKLGICNGRQIQIHEEGGDMSKAFLTINIYHNGTIMFQGNEASLSSVQTDFNSLKALAQSEKHTETADESKSSGAELEEEEPILDCDTQLEQSVNQIRSSLSLQEVELVELRELLLSQTTSSERIQHLENKLDQLTREFKNSVEELRGEIKKLQQDKETLNRELKCVREEMILIERETQSLREQKETLTQPSSTHNTPSNTPQTPAHPPLTPPETNTPTAQADTPKRSQEEENTSRNAEIVILMDSNGKFINEKQLFPNHRTLKLWCPNTESALQQLGKDKLRDPSHIIIHVGTNNLRTQQERVAQSVIQVAIKATQTFPTSKIIISTILPRTDFHPRTIQRVNTDISRGCAGMPNVHLAHHPTLDIQNLHDHVHLRKDSVSVFAKNLKDVALGRTPGSPSKSNTEFSNPQPKRHFIPVSPHSILPPNPTGPYTTAPWRLRQRHPVSQHFRPVPTYTHPERQRPRFRPPHPHPTYEHPAPDHHHQHQDLMPSYHQRKKQPEPREAPVRGNNPSTEQNFVPQPNLHRPEQQEQLNYAAALKDQNDTRSSNLREIKDMLNIICTRLTDQS